MIVRVCGAVLLVAAGVGLGNAAANSIQTQWQSIRQFMELLSYIQRFISQRSMPCEEIFQYAALSNRFAGLHLERCQQFSELPIPQCLQNSIGKELQDNLTELGASSQETATALLEIMHSLCAWKEQEFLTKASAAQALYPKLGGCVGAVIAVFMI